MQINKEALAVTVVGMLTAIAITFIVLITNEALSANNAAATSPAKSPSRVVVHESVVTEAHSDHQKKKNKNSLNKAVSIKSPGIFILGDSSVDCGENTLYYPLVRRNLSTIPCSNGSESTLVPHFLARKMGLADIPGFYDQNGTIEGIVSGLNYGSAGATILTNPERPTFQSLNKQLRQASETIQLLQLQLGEAEATHLIKSSIFFISLGKEDYINFLFDNPSSVPDFRRDAQAFTLLLVDQMTNALRDLYHAGARKIVSMGILPLGCAPRTVVEWYFRTGKSRRTRACVNEVNQLVQQYNQELNERIIDLNVEASDAQFVFCDVYQGMQQIMSNPQNYEFEDVRGTCCGRGWRGAAVGCQTMSMACNQSSSHVWWDFYNPTGSVNCLLADSAWSGEPLPDICRPYSVQHLLGASW